jgi:hypothetical protein
VHGAIQIVYEQRRLYPILVSALLGIFEFLLPAPMLTVVLSRMRLANIDGQKFEARAAIIPIKFIDGRDLAHEGRSSDTAEFQQNVFFVTEIGKPYSRSLDARQLEI